MPYVVELQVVGLNMHLSEQGGRGNIRLES